MTSIPEDQSAAAQENRLAIGQCPVHGVRMESPRRVPSGQLRFVKCPVKGCSAQGTCTSSGAPVTLVSDSTTPVIKHTDLAPVNQPVTQNNGFHETPAKVEKPYNPLYQFLHWGVINLGFGAAPLALMMLCRSLTDRPGKNIVECIPELTFLSVMVGVVVASDLQEVRHDHPKKDGFMVAQKAIFLAAFAGSAFLGMYFWAIIVGPPKQQELHKLLIWSVIVATIYVILCLYFEWKYQKVKAEER